MVQTILIVEDDPAQSRYLVEIVGRQGYRTIAVDGGQAAIDLLLRARGEAVDLVLLDLVMPEVDGLEVLRQLHPERPDLPIVVLTVKGSIDTVVEVMRAGAADFVVKPAAPERLRVTIENAIKVTALSDQVSRLTRRGEGNTSFADVVAESPTMDRTIDLARRAAASAIPILIEGESGVGKELMARAIQGSSDRAGRPFVAVNCGAIPENLVESILFGHEKGAFTGADSRHAGKFLEADGGTLFLDEIGELRGDLQVKLLRALQEGEVDPVGASKPVKIDVRLISATNQDLASLVAEKRFREDLFYRLNVFPIHMPPLRHRPEDVAPLAERFIASYAAQEGKNLHGIDASALEMLQAQSWPGNVRQLENSIFRAVVLSEGEILTPADFPHLKPGGGTAGEAGAGATGPGAAGGSEVAGLAALAPGGELRPLRDVENDMIIFAIEHCRGRMTEVARRLGIGRSTLYRKVRELGIEVGEER
ncbi:MAG: sigma-54 dependent transcriptional regulator [Alphaproteobacteria bacterium]|nr:sigma-54-dependent Fis family transcriptional regulator [Rhodospirillaceae bacterium]MDP6404874.1 sigma-54 dependent transcriptional regulator [Alphaproteobacteria bacterium]MDP6623901.1 sigma-54 dependent transcriptional regulator [Alphaproteobacteria bacterium]